MSFLWWEKFAGQIETGAYLDDFSLVAVGGESMKQTSHGVQQKKLQLPVNMQTIVLLLLLMPCTRSEAAPIYIGDGLKPELVV